jgi:hypothetical protein
VIKAIIADALGMHLDQFQRIAVDPASLTVIRYTTLRPFLVRLNDVGGDLSMLRPPKRRHRRPASSDAVIGGGAGVSATVASPPVVAHVDVPAPAPEAIPAGASGNLADDRIGSKA